MAAANCGAPSSAPIALKTKMFYGSGQAVDAIVQAGVNTFLLFYLTAIHGLSGSAAGAIFLLSLVVDGLLDPFIGRSSDNWRSSWGRRLPFMVAAPIPIALALGLMFSIPTGFSATAVFGAVLFLNVVVRVGLSIFALPHSALTAELTSDYSERSVISAFRAIFIVIGTAAALLPAFAIIFAEPRGLETLSGYPWLGLWLGSIVIAFSAACVLGIARTAAALPTPERTGQEHGESFFGELRQLGRNKSFVYLFVAAVLVLAGQGASSALNLHAFRFFWKLPTDLIQAPLLLLPAGMLIGTIAASLMLKRIEKRNGLIAAVLVAGLYPIITTFLAIAGIVQPGSTAGIAVVMIYGLVAGACGATCFVCFYSMIADAVDEHDDLFGVRREALYAAALMIGVKAATGIGAFLAGLGLQIIGFVLAGSDSSASLPADTTEKLGILWGPVSATIVLAALPFLFLYKVDRVHHAEILSRIAARQK